MRTRRTIPLLGVLAVAAGALSATTTILPVAAKDSVVAQAAKGELRPASIPITIHSGGPQSRATTVVSREMPFFSGGVLDAAKEALEPDARDTAGDTGAPAGGSGAAVVPARTSAGSSGASDDHGGTLGIALDSLGCSHRNSDGNVRVNQDCSYRRQAEEMIAYNPADPNNILAGQNDSRVGFNQCGIDWSLDNGNHWGDLLPPFRQKLNNPAAEEPTTSDPNRHTIQGGAGTLHTYDADSDPTVAFDSRGNGYFSCVAFDVVSNAGLVWVGLSPAGAQGSFFFNLASFDRNFVVAEDNTAEVVHDKELITADKFVSSPNRDNVYVTWTVFRFSPNCGPQPNPKQVDRFCESPIFGSMSTDHAHHWSTPVEISGSSDSLCFFGGFFTHNAADEHLCNFDQGSEPSVLPNGDLEVTFNNRNTAADNPNNQQLGVHCHPTGSSPAGTAHLNCAAPAKVGDDVTVGEPRCNFGRGPEECIPGAFIRTNDFPRISHNTQNGHLYATWQDYRNGEFDIQMSRSLDGGLTWHEVGTVNPDRGLDHYFADAEQSPSAGGGEDRANGEDNGSGDRVGDSYYRTQRVPNENATPPHCAGFPTGVTCFAPGQPGVQASNSDYVLAGGTDGDTPYNFKVLSPVFAPPDGIQAGFNGDYSGLMINRGIEAHPVWSDTRNANPFPGNGVTHDEDIFTDHVGLPSGRAEEEAGVIGRS